MSHDPPPAYLNNDVVGPTSHKIPEKIERDVWESESQKNVKSKSSLIAFKIDTKKLSYNFLANCHGSDMSG